MIKFNTLLRDEGLNPSDVKLVRHQTPSGGGRLTPYQLWHANDSRFELYQSIQGSAIFSGAKMLASFVATPLNETLFVGLYDIDGMGKAPRGLVDPISGKDVRKSNSYYHLSLSQKLADYQGRLTVKWGEGYRAWVQLARKQDKTIVEIRRTLGDAPFPGFLNFCSLLSDLKTVPISWREVLSAVSGIYLLTCPKTGKHYVGSASGLGGFWSRWEDYVASGHGGNHRMKEIPKADYQVTLLEVASSSTGVNDLAQMETRWKRKLLSRKFGLNAN
jgi:hypothetical protein